MVWFLKLIYILIFNLKKIIYKKYFQEYWDVPEWIDESNLNECIRKIGFTLDYRRLCRFMPGFIFRHELTLKYDCFMKIDSDSLFQCEFSSDF